MMTLTAYIRGVGVIGPGIADWPALRALFAQGGVHEPAATQIPPLAVLPPAERRRVGNIVKLALATGLQTCTAAGVDPATLPTVFASSGGDGANCHTICETLASSDRMISPTRFHNSVNNAASGYWGIATGAQAASTIISAYDGSFAAGLLEAGVQLASDGGDILLISHDAPYPEPLAATRPMADMMGVGLLLSADADAPALARISITLDGDATPSRLDDPALEALRTSIPTATALPLLRCLARILDGEARSACTLPYLDDLRLTVTLEALS
ncbi:MAG: beta-ketoacyl synthase chain length factor [Rhodocyclales bacterium]|nr:beta-ketoacyl synthase chain length factor [Rhodocyclales bacterium]